MLNIAIDQLVTTRLSVYRALRLYQGGLPYDSVTINNRKKINDAKCMYECQEVSNTALHNFPRSQALRISYDTQISIAVK